MRSWVSQVLSCVCPSSAGGRRGTGQALRVGIVGASGTGKTSLLKEIVRAIPVHGISRSLVYSPYPGIVGLHCYTVREAYHSLSRAQSTTVISDPDLYRALMPQVLKRGQIVLVIDEAHELFPRAKPDPLMIKVLREGRNRGVGLCWSTQRPTACHTDLLSISQGIVIGRLIGLADMSYSKQWGVSQPLDMYSFMVVLPGVPAYQIKSQRIQ